MAIDINSGKSGGNNKNNFEGMAFRTNLEAAEAIPQQLRLRDIGGQVVIDFIEMRDKNHVRDVEKVLRQAMKNDRARHDIGRISSFGLLELVRQRTGSSALAITTELCPCCNGSGLRRNMEWQALQTLRGFSRHMRGMNPGSACSFELSLELGLYLLNEKRERLRELEKLHSMHIEIRLLQA
jgi:ribonuclease E